MKKNEEENLIDDALTLPEPPPGINPVEEEEIEPEQLPEPELEDEEPKEETMSVLTKDEVIADYEKETDSLHKKQRKIKLSFFVFGVVTLSAIAFFIQNKTVWNIEPGPLIGGLSFSILFNVVILLALFGSGMGQEITGRLKRRLLFRSGMYVNTLFVSKNGPIKEVFKKVDKETGSFKIFGKTYARNPSLLHHFQRIPTYMHREGTVDPINAFENGLASDMSNAEVDNVMNSKNAFDFKEWLQKNIMMIFIGLFVMVVACVVSAYFGYNSFQMLRDGTFEAAKVVVTNATTIVPTVI